jgi:hypothetical protein
MRRFGRRSQQTWWVMEDLTPLVLRRDDRQLRPGQFTIPGAGCRRVGAAGDAREIGATAEEERAGVAGVVR